MPIKSDSRDTRSTAKRLRSLRALISQQSWLRWQLHWTGERIEYTNGKDAIFPESDILARTQRQLHRVYEQGELVARVIDDPESWKREQLELLAVAKYVATLTRANFLELEREARRKTAGVVATLVNLIATEALVTNALPRSPSHLLTRVGAPAEPELRDYLQSERRSLKARALAALALGRIHAEMLTEGTLNRKQLLQSICAGSNKLEKKASEWLMRCYRWGLEESGQEEEGATGAADPEYAIVIVEILQRTDGLAPLRRLLSNNNKLRRMRLSMSTVKRLILQETDVATICSIIEELQQLEGLAIVVLNFRDHLKRSLLKTKQSRRVAHAVARSKHSEMDEQRNRFVERLRTAVEELIRTAPSAISLRELYGLLNHLFATYESGTVLFAEVEKVLKNAAKLPAPLPSEYLAILNRYAGVFWQAVTNEPPPDSIRCPNCLAIHDTYSNPDAAQPEKPNPEQGLPVVRPTLGGIDSPTTDLLYLALKGSGSPALCKQIIENKLIGSLTPRTLKNARALPILVDWIERIDLTRWLRINQFFEIVELFPDVDSARQSLEPFVCELEKAPFSTRGHFFEALDVIHARKSIKKSIATVTRFIPHLIALSRDEDPESCSCVSLMNSAMEISAQVPHLEAELFVALTEAIENKKPLHWRKLDQVKPACLLTLATIKTIYGKPRSALSLRQKRAAQTLMRQNVERFMTRRCDLDSGFVEAGMRLLNDYPILCRLIAEHFNIHPHRAENLVQLLGVAKRFGPEAMKGLDKLERYEPSLRLRKTAGKAGRAGIEKHMLKRLYAKGWNEIITVAPDTIPFAASYICSRNLLQAPQEPPEQLTRLLKNRLRIEKEREYLRELVCKNPDRPNLKKRLENLEQRLQEKTEVDEFSIKLINKQMKHLAMDAEMDALERVMKEVFIRQLKRIVGALPDRVTIDSYMINALLLTQDVRSNRRLLKKLINAHVWNDTQWRQRIEKNRAFLAQLAAQGVDVDCWLGEHPRTYKIEGVEGECVTLVLESDPLKVLEMGNYFDTCLSFLGVNSFSTVVNACDLNKRVVYARDKRGRVIGRKLIAVTTEGKLVGYRTYLSLPDRDVRKRLSNAFIDFLQDFARRCPLPPSNQGEVATLSSSVWYDDGIVDWEAEPAPLTCRKGSPPQ